MFFLWQCKWCFSPGHLWALIHCDWLIHYRNCLQRTDHWSEWTFGKSQSFKLISSFLSKEDRLIISGNGRQLQHFLAKRTLRKTKRRHLVKVNIQKHFSSSWTFHCGQDSSSHIKTLCFPNPGSVSLKWPQRRKWRKWQGGPLAVRLQ